ncbi:putative lipid II flippase FtsW [Diaminobutyricimonas sp. TR449]|uniref:putative lipid II flippase FtsW n=1 Tax=Diaminobutyricimonas sp. TR449 TaxID=2708076 RepID=UPI0014246251|nr:putative lipid II flippase FtsW [Diaminobutyricimonas sp. TR449]
MKHPIRRPFPTPGSRSESPAATETGDDAERKAPVAFVAVKRIFAAETGNYFLLLGTTLFLVIFGLVMVLSSSAVQSLKEQSDAFAEFHSQGVYLAIGVPLMLVVSRFPASFWKRWAWPAVVVGVVLQMLVFTPLGYGYGGNLNWLDLGAFTIQPSELVKLALCLWLAFILTTKRELLGDWKHVAVPIAPVAGVAIGLVLLGNDLGTVVIMLAIVFGSLFFAGVRLRFLVLPLIAIAGMGLIVAQLSSSRRDRIEVWLNGCPPEEYLNNCWQVLHGTWALASGGLFGVGLGNSKTKWSWLPHAETDYIFSIIGEELGLIGAVVVLLLFVVLAIAFVRIIRANRDPFARLTTGAVMIWIVGQALVNIAVVLGLLPVLGVPLPLISAGGSALITTLLAIGVVLSFARTPKHDLEDHQRMSPAERSRWAAAQRSRTTP